MCITNLTQYHTAITLILKCHLFLLVKVIIYFYCKFKFYNLSLLWSILAAYRNLIVFSFCIFTIEASVDCGMRSTPSPPAIQSYTSHVHDSRQRLHQGGSSLEEELFENVREVCLQPHTVTQHNKVTLVVNLSNIMSLVGITIIYAAFMLFHPNLKGPSASSRGNVLFGHSHH